MTNKHPLTAALTVALALLVTSCTGDEDNSVAPPASTTSTTTTPRSTTTTEATTTTTSVDTDSAIQTWEQILDDATSGDQLPDTTPAAADVIEQLNTIFAADTRDLDTNPTATLNDDDSVTINDCVITDKPLSTHNSVWLSGTLTQTTTGWQLDTFTPESLVGCVPAAMVQPILDAYQTYTESTPAYFDPPNPTAPELAATTTGRQLELYQNLASDFKANGTRGVLIPAESHPEIIRVFSRDQVVIGDCQLTNPDAGVYDISTGNRTDVFPPVVVNQRDVLETTMVLDGGTWKVEDVQGRRGTTCEFAPSAEGLPTIPAADNADNADDADEDADS